MLSPDALILQLSFMLLVIAMLQSNMRRARLLVALAALIALGRALLWTGDLVTVGWMAALAAACLMLIAHSWYGNQGVRFSDEEREMVDRLLPGLAKRSARHVLDQGLWLNGNTGDELTREGEPVHHLYYLADGEARVISLGHHVGVCRSGDLVGELTVLSGERASATVILDRPSRFWCAEAEVLRPYVEAHEDIRRAIEHSFASALKSKLRASNRVIAESGGVAPGA
jgi:hypothetical protein